MKVLIADDSSVSRRLLEVTLQRWDYDVQVACDGAEAWSVLEKPEGPTLAILDWMMPRMTGPDVCRLVRQGDREQYVYLLLLTSKGQREDLIEGMEAGADDYLVKPFDQNELKVRLRAGRRILDLQSQLMEAREALRVQATRDSLTGLWNRRAALEALLDEMRRATRDGGAIGVVLCDLDYFKKVNDTYGHAAGDSVLQEAALRMSQGLRSYDTVGRYGGEEFLIILPGCDDDVTEQKAERLRELLAAHTVHADSNELVVTGSFGSTCWTPGSGMTLETIIGVADDALYEAKRQGRNRVVAYRAERRVVPA
ncbi:MAG: diguanylate cyclase [Bryobacteraceae bacterium]